MTDASPARQFLLEPGSLGSLKALREADSGLMLSSCLDAFRGLVSSYDKGGDSVKWAAKRMRDWFAERAGDVVFAGEGTARMAFVTRDGRCLKLAKSWNGVDQNREEISVLSGKPGFAVRMLGFDRARSPLALETEACEKATIHEAKRVLAGLGCEAPKAFKFRSLTDALCELGRAGMDVEKAVDIVMGLTAKKITLWDSREEVEAVLASVLRGKTAQARVFRELAEFYAEDWKKRLARKKDFISLADVGLDNFGVVVRDGERLMVVLDAGM